MSTGKSTESCERVEIQIAINQQGLCLKSLMKYLGNHVLINGFEYTVCIESDSFCMKSLEVIAIARDRRNFRVRQGEFTDPL